MTTTPPELDAILQEVERALKAELYYLAVAVALSIPDICACLEFDPDKPGWANDKTYAPWCDANLNFKNLAGIDFIAFAVACCIGAILTTVSRSLTGSC